MERCSKHVEEYRTTNLDRDALRVFQQQVSEQVLHEKITFLEQELQQRRRLIRRILGFVVDVVFIIAAVAVAVAVLQKTIQTCEKWSQNKKVGRYVIWLTQSLLCNV